MNAAANTNATESPRPVIVYTTIVGSKYEATKDLDISAIAKLIRADIAKAIECGALPAVKVSVRVAHASMCQSINAAITSVPEGFAVRVSAEETEHQRNAGCPYPWLSREACFAQSVLRRIVEQYNIDRSHSQSDYYNEKYSSSVGFAVE